MRQLRPRPRRRTLGGAHANRHRGEQWETTNVTVLADTIHSMTPCRCTAQWPARQHDAPSAARSAAVSAPLIEGEAEMLICPKLALPVVCRGQVGSWALPPPRWERKTTNSSLSPNSALTTSRL